ncbi:hypothetical protein GOODEAATRI_022354 [Goodea atripinnis]|uniref:CCHC-type domain-containing protein n=1 Tax=Goodea atripinnis TaxID=208336 RepID=A0ABV0NCP0_9TELE
MVTPIRQMSPATSGYQLTPELLPNHRLNSPGVVHTYLPGGGATAGVSNQQPAVRPKLTNQSKGVHDQQLQYRTPAPQPNDGGVDTQHTTAPPILSPYGDHYAAPPLTGIHVTTTSLPPQPPTGNQIMQQPAAPSICPHPTGIYQPASQDRAGYAGCPTVPQGPLYSSASGAWGVLRNRSNPQFMNHAAYNHTNSIYGHSRAAYDGFLQTHQMAFEELRAEYGDTQSSLDPLADFYERSQRPGESACSYAISLEANLKAVEDSQRGGKPFPDRDCKLTRQFLRGLNDEEVYMRIAPLKPRLLSFQELQAELRDMSKETKKFQSLYKFKRAHTQIQTAPASSPMVKMERTSHASELSELTELVKKLALRQGEQMDKLTYLESRVATPPAPSPVPPPRVHAPIGPPTQRATVTCYRCRKQGHIARVCRAVLPDPSQLDENTPHPAQPLNR